MILRRTPDRRRARQLATGSSGALHGYLSHPFPPPSTDHTSLRLLAVDLETTGLDPDHDRIVSIGFVPVDGTSIVLAGAGQLVVRGTTSVGQSATVHGLTDDTVAAGLELSEALDRLLEALAGRVLLAHHAALEQGFLDVACRRVHGQPLPTLAVDTMALEHRLLTSGWHAGRDRDIAQGSLRLSPARERRGLPRYRAHDALTDALACAELYLAQVAELGRGRPVTLRQLTRGT
jgi:DNA polymerase-3 subunit epsilon